MAEWRPASAIPFAPQVFDQRLDLTDQAIRVDLAGLIAELAELAERAPARVDLAA
jgi:hypothetical protein